MFYKNVSEKRLKKNCFFFFLCYSVLVDLDATILLIFNLSGVIVKRFQMITYDSSLTYLQFFFENRSLVGYSYNTRIIYMTNA